MDFADRTGFVGRMVGAARFEKQVYRDLAADRTLLGQAAAVVLLGAVATGIASGLGVGGFIAGFFSSILLVVLGWLFWSAVTWFVGTRMMKSTATFGAVARGLGFAQSPALLRIFGFVPVLGGIVQAVTSLWILATGFYAIRETMRLSTGETIATVIVGFVAYIVLVFVISALIFVALGPAI